MDDPITFPYKLPQMRRVFDAFNDMLCRASAAPVNATDDGSTNHEI
jgi:hypothetical protein